MAADRSLHFYSFVHSTGSRRGERRGESNERGCEEEKKMERGDTQEEEEEEEEEEEDDWRIEVKIGREGGRRR